VVTRRLQAERRTGSVHRPKTDVPPTVLRNQPDGGGGGGGPNGVLRRTRERLVMIMKVNNTQNNTLLVYLVIYLVRPPSETSQARPGLSGPSP